ncbi:MAG: ATP-binding protein [Rhodoferax sp.]|nr:ATP-binding protein [Rhodoferax sp.]
MNGTDLFNLLEERKALPALRATDAWGALARESELRMQPDDVLTKSGWTRREVDAVQFPEGTEAAKMHRLLAVYWLERWSQADAAAQAAQLVAEESRRAANALWVSQAPERERIAREKAAKEKANRRRARWVEFGPPGKLGRLKQHDLTIDTAQQRKAVAVINADDDAPTLCLLGTPGTGKSSFAALWLRKEFAAGKEVQWVTGFDFAEDVDSNDPEDVIDSHEWAESLVLDDIEADFPQPAQRALAEVFDRRRQNRGATCFTTNLTKPQLEKMFGPRNYSRLMAGAKVLPLTGKDYRLSPCFAGEMQ